MMLFFLVKPRANRNAVMVASVPEFLHGETGVSALLLLRHVEDVAAAIWKVAESPILGPVNIGTGRPTKVKEVLNILADLCEQPDLIERTLPGQEDSYYANNARLCSLGSEPRYTLEEGLKATVEWWRAQIG